MKVKYEPTKKEDEQAITLVTLLEFQNYIKVSVDSSIYKHAFFPVFFFTLEIQIKKIILFGDFFTCFFIETLTYSSPANRCQTLK